MTGSWIDAVAVMAAVDAEAFEGILERQMFGLDVTYWKRECSGAAPLAILGLELRDESVLRRLEEALDAERPSFVGQHPAIIPVRARHLFAFADARPKSAGRGSA